MHWEFVVAEVPYTEVFHHWSMISGASNLVGMKWYSLYARMQLKFLQSEKKQESSARRSKKSSWADLVNDVSTKFVDWVEKDFLDLDKWNIKSVTFDNYEVKDGKIVPSAKQILDYADSEWKLIGSYLKKMKSSTKRSLIA